MIFSIAIGGVLIWRGGGAGGRRTWMLAVAPVVVAFLLIGWFVVHSAGQREHAMIRRMLEGFAPTYADALSRMGHADLPSDVAEDDPRYLAMIDAEKRWLAATPVVHDIYTMRRRSAGVYFFLVDSETDYDRNGVFEGEREQRTPVGEEYLDDDPWLERAFAGELVFDAEPSTDRWGTWVSVAAPMRDAQGRVEAVLGVDYPADLWTSAVRWSRLGAVGLLGLSEGVVLAVVTVILRLRMRVQQAHLAQLQLEESRALAEQASQAKSQFLANMSHELRTPLNAILGYSELLREEALDAGNGQLAEDLSKIHNAGALLLELINDVLDISKIEAGRMEVHLETFRVADLIKDVTDIVRPIVKKKGNELEVAVGSDVGEMHADMAKVRQSLLNLLSNASKFTENGRVGLTVRRVRARGEDDAEDGEVIEFSVSDSGIGMTDEQKSRIFTAYTQAEPTTSKKYGGTGLGLMLTRRFCRLMGGDVLVESQYGKGSTFVIRLPAVVLGAVDADSLDTRIGLIEKKST